MSRLDVPTARAIMRQSLYAFVEFLGVCSFGEKSLLSERTFHPICSWVQDAFLHAHRRNACWDPRNHIKTTLITRAVPLWLALQEPSLEHDSPAEYERARSYLAAHPDLRGPNTRILIASSSKENAVRQARAIRSFPEQNTLFRTYFPELCPENFDVLGRRRIWNEQEFTLATRTIDYPEPYVDTAGVTSRSVGRHYDLIIFDDPVNETNWKSEPEIQTAIEWLLFCENLLEVADLSKPNASTIIEIGNFWTYYDVASYIDENLPTYRRWRRAAYVCSHCGYGNCLRTPSCSYTAEPLWPERWTIEGLAKLKKTLTHRVFAAQYLNDPIAGESTAFSLESLRYSTVTQTSGDTWSITTFRDSDAKPLSSFRGVISIDPATSTDPRSCRTAILVLAEDRETSAVHLVDLKAGHLDPRDTVEAILNLYLYWRSRGLPIAHVGVETVGGAKFILPALISAARVRGDSRLAPFGVPPDNNPHDLLQLYKTDRNVIKEERITNLLRWRVDAGLLYVNVALPDRALFEEEFSRFPAAKSNDILDALAYAEQIYSRNVRRREAVSDHRERLLRAAYIPPHAPLL